MDIREIALVFLNFLYDNKVFPDEIQKIINESEKVTYESQRGDTRSANFKYDISTISRILQNKNNFKLNKEEYNPCIKKVVEEKDSWLSLENCSKIFNWI